MGKKKREKKKGRGTKKEVRRTNQMPDKSSTMSITKVLCRTDKGNGEEPVLSLMAPQPDQG